MPTVNEKLLDHSIQHSIDSICYSNGVVRRMISLLTRVEPDLIVKISAALERLPNESFTVQRLDNLLKGVRELNAEAYKSLLVAMESELHDLVIYEAEYQQGLFEAVIPVKLSIAPVNVESVYAAAVSRPFQSRLMKEWAQSLEEGKAIRIRDALRHGYVQGETIDQMVTRIRGTRAKGYADELLEIDRRNAAAVVRTATSHVSGFVRDRFYEDNEDIVKSIQWISTLDGRTSSVCRAHDHHTYSNDTHKPLDGGPLWGAGPGRIHWNCRSTSVPVLKSWRELGIDINDEPPSTRASIDGQVPESTTYGQWLGKRSVSEQDDILGKSRGKLFRAGMPMERFVDRAGAELTLAEMRVKDAALFKRAGI